MAQPQGEGELAVGLEEMPECHMVDSHLPSQQWHRYCVRDEDVVRPYRQLEAQTVHVNVADLQGLEAQPAKAFRR